jgi:hypothetical protein
LLSLTTQTRRRCVLDERAQCAGVAAACVEQTALWIRGDHAQTRLRAFLGACLDRDATCVVYVNRSVEPRALMIEASRTVCAHRRDSRCTLTPAARNHARGARPIDYGLPVTLPADEGVAPDAVTVGGRLTRDALTAWLARAVVPVDGRRAQGREATTVRYTSIVIRCVRCATVGSRLRHNRGFRAGDEVRRWRLACGCSASRLPSCEMCGCVKFFAPCCWCRSGAVMTMSHR